MGDRMRAYRWQALYPLRRWIAFLLGWWIALMGLWLLFVDTLAPPEVLVGLAAAAAATFSGVVIRAYGEVRFRFQWRWLLLLRGVPTSVLGDSWVLTVALWRRLVRGEHPASALRTVPFPLTPHADDPTAASWHAFVIMATSIAPNTYVIGVDHARNTALIHQLAPDPADQTRSALVGVAPDAARRRG